MSIPLNFLALTDFRAVGITVYGGGGQRKTFGIHTLPYPIRLCDFEGGGACLMPWIARRRRYNDSKWFEVTQEVRQQAFNLLSEDNRRYCLSNDGPRIPPSPLIDIIRYDVLEFQAWEQFVIDLANIDLDYYNSIALDSLHEFSMETQTFSKYRQQVSTDEPMHVKLWSGAQDRAGIQLRKLENYRDKGVFVYFTGSEFIDKDYVNDPRETKPGKKGGEESAFSVKGTVKVPGRLVADIQHVSDVMLRARTLGDRPTWVLKQEPLPSGAYWETKDRTGRLKNPYNEPNVRRLLDQIYGEEMRKQIYAVGRKEMVV